MLFEDFLNTISYFYYPKDKSVFDIDYNDRLEVKRYLEKVNLYNSNKSEFTLFLKNLGEKINPLSIVEFNMGLNFPSYNFQIVLDLNTSKMNVLSIYVSHLIPFFHLCQLEGNNKKVYVNNIYSSEVSTIVNIIKNEITSRLFFYEFPRDILLKEVPNIRIEENFTYLNAFFIDSYRIINF